MQENSKPQYEHIELELEEAEEALRVAREDKHYRLKRQAYYERIAQPIEYKSYTAEELYQMFVDAGYTFADTRHENKIKHLCLYFAGDQRSHYAADRGLLLMGNIGSGKTSIMKMFACNQVQPYKVENMIDITSDYKIHGEAGVKGYTTNFKTAPNMFGKEIYGWCFDDVGTEEMPARHYGENKNVFAEILQSRYHHQHLVPLNSTHVTTNLTEEELVNNYGTRAYDRMKEMFNVIIFEHGSFRK
jgi:DNA replication protein DnaC